MSTVSVRYIVDDVDAAIAFYRDRLGFRELMHPDPAFAMLTLGDLRLVLVAPVPADHPGGGSRPMPDGTRQRPGGWNRFMLEVPDLAAAAGELRDAGAGRAAVDAQRRMDRAGVIAGYRRSRRASSRSGSNSSTGFPDGSSIIT